MGIGVVISLERGANDLHMVQLMPLPPIISCFSKIQNGLPFWCWLIQIVLEKRPLNVCVCYMFGANVSMNTDIMCWLLKATWWRKVTKGEIWCHICIYTLRESAWEYQKITTGTGVNWELENIMYLVWHLFSIQWTIWTFSIHVSNGMKQDCVLAALLFSIFFSTMLLVAFKNCHTGIPVHFRPDGSVFNLRRL